MKITTVTYQKTYSIGPYLTERIGFEAQPEGNPGDAPMDMLTMLEELADEWHKKAHPHLQQEPELTRFPPQLGVVAEIQTERTDPNDTLALIQNAPTLEVLTTFKLLVGKDTDLYNAYCKRIKELA
jgi:hypothetical protein